jgi:hypothetical protein
MWNYRGASLSSDLPTTVMVDTLPSETLPGNFGNGPRNLVPNPFGAQFT